MVGTIGPCELVCTAQWQLHAAEPITQPLRRFVLEDPTVCRECGFIEMYLIGRPGYGLLIFCSAHACVRCAQNNGLSG